MARILDLDELPHEPHSHEFVGADHDDVPFSIILVHSHPGVGPKLHRHPYAEVFMVESGEATFQIGETQHVVPAGHVVVSPPGEAHGFVNSGTGELRLIAIHAAGRFNTECWTVRTRFGLPPSLRCRARARWHRRWALVC